MFDEFGCVFYDTCFLVYQPEDEKTDIQQHFEQEKEKWLREYPLEHPEYELVFDCFVETPEPFESGDKIGLGFVVFRAYEIQQRKTMALEKS